MALQLKNDELAIVLALARPISAARQPQFLQEVAAELRPSAARTRGLGGIAWLERFDAIL